MCTTATTSTTTAVIQEALVAFLTNARHEQETLGPILKELDEFGDRQQIADALDSLVTAAVIDIRDNQSETVEVFLAHGLHFDSLPAAEAITEWQRLWDIYVSPMSADETALLRMLERISLNGSVRARDLRPVITEAGWSAERVRTTLSSLADREKLDFHRSRDQECYIGLYSFHAPVMPHADGLAAFNLTPAAKLFTVVAYPASSIDSGTDGRIWRSLTEQEGIRLSDRLISDGWIVCGFDAE